MCIFLRGREGGFEGGGEVDGKKIGNEMWMM